MLLALLRKYVRPYRGLVAMVMLLQTISTLASLYLPTVNARIIDDGVARGDTGTIVRLGGVMLAVTALQVACAIGAVYFGSRAGLGFGRDARAAMFHHITTFSEHETTRFGPATLLTRSTNDVQQIQMLVQMTFTMLVTAPIMCVGGIVMAVHQDAGLSWLLVISVPVLAVANGLIIRRMLPIFRRMQRLIDAVNRVLREQLSGIRVIRAFARESVERDRFRVAFVAAAVRAGELVLASGDALAARDLAARAIAEEPWSEPARRLLVAAYLESGDRAAARRALVACRAMLEDLGVRAEPETEILARRLGESP